MKLSTFGSLVVAAGVALMAVACLAQSYSQFHVKLPMVQRSALPGIEGRLDHLAFDPKSGALYVACRRAGSVECLDPTWLRGIQSVKDLPEPSGMVFLADQRLLAVACGDGKVRLYKADDAGQLSLERAVEYRGEADNIRYDAKGKRVYVGFQRFISSFDPATGEKGKDLELPGVPEGFVLEDAGPRMFINIAKKGQVVVVDRAAEKVLETWTLKNDTRGNYAMTADQPAGRLFVACRSPSQLVVLDMKNGGEVARVDIGPDSDDAWYDFPSKRVYVTCGGQGGQVSMVQQENADKYTLEHNETTAPGAATSLLVPEKRRLIVASPQSEPGGYTFLFIYLIPP